MNDQWWAPEQEERVARAIERVPASKQARAALEAMPESEEQRKLRQLGERVRMIQWGFAQPFDRYATYAVPGWALQDILITMSHLPEPPPEVARPHTPYIHKMPEPWEHRFLAAARAFDMGFSVSFGCNGMTWFICDEPHGEIEGFGDTFAEAFEDFEYSIAAAEKGGTS